MAASKQPSTSMPSPEQVGCGIFPYDENVVFKESSFFKKPDSPLSLPSPTEVREIASQSTDPRARKLHRPPPVLFPSIGLLVKYGTGVTLSEGQCLLLVRKLLSTVVPVPEVYGWCRNGGQTFLFMELVDGVTLEKNWETMAEDERISVCEQLRRMIEAWRCLRQDPPHHFIGHVGLQPLLDIIFINSCSPTAGPFPSVSDFHDWFTSAYGPTRDVHGKPPHPYRSFLPDSVPIIFTHADLHPSNIMLSRGPNPRIIAIIDWHQSGWYPAYWEYCKARWTSVIGQEWEAKYLPTFLDRHDCYNYWDYFVLARGV